MKILVQSSTTKHPTTIERCQKLSDLAKCSTGLRRSNINLYGSYYVGLGTLCATLEIAWWTIGGCGPLGGEPF